MRLPHTIEPMREVKVNGKTIQVSSLPIDVQYEIRTWERFYQEYVDAVYSLEKAEILLKAKREQVESLLRDLLKDSEQKENTQK